MMQELLLDVWNDYRMTILFVTHDIDPREIRAVWEEFLNK